MAKGPEGLLYKRVKEHLPNAVITRVENKVTMGFPDCLIALPQSGYVLMELKVVTSGKLVRMSPHQIAFALKHGRMGMPTYLLVEWHPKSTKKLSEKVLLLYHGTQVQELVARGLETRPIDHWPLNAVNWEQLRQHLVDNDSKEKHAVT